MDEKLAEVTHTDSGTPRSDSGTLTPASETRPTTMTRKKVSTTVYIEPEQAERLKMLHDRTKVPVAVYIREGIELVLAHHGHLLPGQLPLDVKRHGGSGSGTGTGTGG